MLDHYQHEPGKLYPSWQDNPRLVWARALRNLRITADYYPLPEVRVIRTSDSTYRVFVHGIEHGVYTTRGADAAPLDVIIDRMIDQLIALTGDEPMTTTVHPLSTKAKEVLYQLAHGANPAKLDGRSLHALQQRGLVREVKGVLAPTPAGLDEIADFKLGRSDPAPGSGRVILEHTPDPSKAVEVQTRRFVKRQKPQRSQEDDEPMEDFVEAVDIDAAAQAFESLDAADEQPLDDFPMAPDDRRLLASSGEHLPDARRVVTTLAPIRAAEADTLPDHPNDGCGEDCRHKRILDWLVNSSPFVRRTVEQMLALDSSMDRLRSLE